MNRPGGGIIADVGDFKKKESGGRKCREGGKGVGKSCVRFFYQKLWEGGKFHDLETGLKSCTQLKESSIRSEIREHSIPAKGRPARN